MSSEKVDEKHDLASSSASNHDSSSEVDLYSLHEQRAGRLIIDPAYVLGSLYLTSIAHSHLREAKIELGEAVAARLKLSRDGTKVLWPQPTDSPRDPQNWSDRRKTIQLIIITLAAIVPDFDSGIGGFKP